mmetsp:Transcript_23424/g.50735  ORF Transcript_23424/g.50735 Transcript_23424/m.50735 type:complete len:216 (-) Transcript_23424:150-797(-)|eukprot:CAMPEP_0172313338 /NCGR_PEP_ID=MMETSP1058-20130122/20067_1 /TAXON_ID=83371 /ORGANISM="Detonula confervacea, Strain CCMP 353" /LENGTH=215 /DNA_ID=CAMNT_0013026981 /DNA_START=121 /DNA_END=768 /DNA_ORIENTATION=-
MAANFGELVLLLGDHHIPSRSLSIPEPFQRMLVPGKMQRIICTGNIGSMEEYKRLRDLVGGASSSVHCVAGEYDLGVAGGESSSSSGGGGGGGNSAAAPPSFPQTKVIQLGQFRVGIIGGHQVVPWGDLSALAMVKRRLNVDVLVCGGKRKEGVVEHEGGYYIFPGSITGAYSAGTPNVNPSFILLAVQGNKVVCYVYEMKNGEVDVSKTEFSKQ